MSSDKAYIKEYFAYLFRQKGLLSLGLLCIPLITACHLAQPLLLKIGIDNYIVPGKFVGVYTIALLFGLSILGEFLFKSLQSFIFQYIGQILIAEIREDLFHHVISLAPDFFDKTPVGTLTTRITSDVESLNESFSSGVVTILGDFLTMIATLAIMAYLSVDLTVLTLVMLIPLAIAVNFLRVKLRGFFNAIRLTIGKINGYLQEQLQGVEVIQIFQRQYQNYQEFKVLSKQYREATLGSVKCDALLYSLVESSSTIFISVLIWYGWTNRINESLTIGLLVSFIEYIHKLFHPLKELSNKFAVMQHALAALEKIFGTYAVKDYVPEGEGIISDVKGHVYFKDVSYAYPRQPGKQVLDKVSFEIKPKQVVAIVGPTGSGKSTIFRLLSRLYYGYSGIISLDGCDISKLSLDSLRRQFSVVSQDVQIFSQTVQFNLTLNQETVSKEEMIAIAKMIDIHTFIESLDQGYQTLLDGSRSLSFGERQLISLGRALLCKAPIVLMDEATASVDSLSEQRIQKAMDKLLDTKTVIVIAHRLSTIRRADKILVLKYGRIIEEGRHEELIEQNGFYTTLFNMQFSDE